MVGPLGGGGNPINTKQKTTFFIKGKYLQKKYEPLRSRGGGGYPDLSGSNNNKKKYIFVCLPLVIKENLNFFSSTVYYIYLMWGSRKITLFLIPQLWK